MVAYPGQTWTTLGQLCAALWDSQSQHVLIQPGIKPGSVVTSLALRCSTLDRCATREGEEEEEDGEEEDEEEQGGGGGGERNKQSKVQWEGLGHSCREVKLNRRFT